MADDVKYTTRPEGETHSRARADTASRRLVVVPAAAFRGANVATQQAIAVAANLPMQVARSLVDAGSDLIVARERNDASAARTAAELQGREIPAVAPSASAPGWVLPAVGGSLVGGFALGYVVAGLLVALMAAVVSAVVVGGAAAASVSAGQRRADDEADQLQTAHDRALEGTHSATWTAIHEVRRRSLDDELPLQAQVDTWSALDALEERLLRDPAAADAVTDQLQELLSGMDAAAPSAASAGEAVDALRRTMQAARAARSETGKLGKP